MHAADERDPLEGVAPRFGRVAPDRRTPPTRSWEAGGRRGHAVLACLTFAVVRSGGDPDGTAEPPRPGRHGPVFERG